MGSCEGDHLALVLGVHEPATLELLRHAVDVVGHVRCCSADVEDDYGLLVLAVCISHICHLPRELDSVVTANQVRS